MDDPRKHVLLLLSGSRGDIQPGTCLALELQRRNRRVSVLCTPNLVGFVRRMGIDDVRPVGMNISEMTDRARDLLAHGNPLQILRFTLHFFRHSTVDLDRDVEAHLFGGGGQGSDGAASAPDLVVANPLCQRQGLDATEKLGTPLVVLRYAPVSENSSIGWISPLTRHLPPRARRASWTVRGWCDLLLTAVWENRFRRAIGLRPTFRPVPARMAARKVPQLQLCDPSVVPEIADEWHGTERVFTGYLDIPAATREAMGESSPADSTLDRWLRSGSAPVFVSFGSMPVADPESVRRTVTDACRARGLRVILGLGEDTGASPTDPDVYEVGAVDQSALLPRCAAAVHHGGAGTTAAGLRAGIPTMIYSFGMEQPFWGSRIRELGVGTTARFRDFSAGRFTQDLSDALSPATVARARAFAAGMITPEEAVTAAADTVESSIP
ncbi:MAG: glycosyltransferase [Mycobacteriaceae bacterium]